MTNHFRGAGIVALSAIFFGSYGVWARLISDHLPNLFQVWTRSLLISVVLAVILILTRSWKNIAKKDLKWVAVYTLFGSCAVAPYFYAFNKLGIGPSTLLFYASLTVVSYLAGFFAFKEKMTLSKIASLILAFIGLFLIFDFSVKANLILAAACAVFSGAGGGIEVCFTKKISDRYRATQISWLLWTVIFIIHFALSLFFGESWTLPSLSVPWIGVLGYSLASLIAFFLVVIGYKYFEPSVGGIIGLLEIIFGIIFGVLLFKEPLTSSVVWGTIFILASATLPNVAELRHKTS